MTFVSRMDAEAWLLAGRRIVQDVGSWHSPKERLAEERLQDELNALPTVEAYAERWIEARRSCEGEPLRPTTKDKYRSNLRTHVYSTFGATPLDQITRAAGRRWHDELENHAARGPVGLLFHSFRDETLHLSQAAMNGRPAVLHADGSVRKAGFGWREARRLAGREDLDLHDLRHTGATWAAEEGASIAELMYRLGHSTPSMAIHHQHSRQEKRPRDQSAPVASKRPARRLKGRSANW